MIATYNYDNFLIDGKNVKITDFNVSKFTENFKDFSDLGGKNEKIKMWTYTGKKSFIFD